MALKKNWRQIKELDPPFEQAPGHRLMLQAVKGPLDVLGGDIYRDTEGLAKPEELSGKTNDFVDRDLGLEAVRVYFARECLGQVNRANGFQVPLR